MQCCCELPTIFADTSDGFKDCTQPRPYCCSAVFQVPSVLLAPSHLMALLTLGINSAMVLDCGYRESLVLPVSFLSASPCCGFWFFSLLILTEVIWLIKIICIIEVFWPSVCSMSYYVVRVMALRDLSFLQELSL